MDSSDEVNADNRDGEQPTALFLQLLARELDNISGYGNRGDREQD